MATTKKSTKASVEATVEPNVAMHYVTVIPDKLPKGEVLVHNWVTPQRTLGAGSFRAWTQKKTDRLEICPCKWAGANLHGLEHYRVKAT